MQIDKQQLLELLNQQGKHDQAGQADRELPDQIDSEQHAGVLQQLGVDPKELMGKLGGGGLGKLLGG